MQLQSLSWEDPLEEEMATHRSVLAWKFPWAEEPGGLQSVGLQRVRHNLVAEQQQKIPWRRKWQPTPVFLPGKRHGQRSLGAYGPRGRKELGMT